MYRECTRDSAPDTVSWRWPDSQPVHHLSQPVHHLSQLNFKIDVMGPVGHESAPFTLALVVLFTVLTDVSTLHMP